MNGRVAQDDGTSSMENRLKQKSPMGDFVRPASRAIFCLDPSFPPSCSRSSSYLSWSTMHTPDAWSRKAPRQHCEQPGPSPFPPFKRPVLPISPSSPLRRGCPARTYTKSLPTRFVPAEARPPAPDGAARTPPLLPGDTSSGPLHHPLPDVPRTRTTSPRLRTTSTVPRRAAARSPATRQHALHLHPI